MTAAQNQPPAPIGHNKPPSPMVQQLKGLVDRGNQAIADRVAELVNAANIWRSDVKEITTPELAAKCEDFLVQLRTELEGVDTARKDARKSHDDAIKAIQDAFRPALTLLDACVNALKPLKAGWLLKEEARQQRERREAEAAAQRARDEAAAALENAEGGGVEDQVAAQQAVEKSQQADKHAEDTAGAKPQVRGAYSGRASGFRTVWSANITDWKRAAVHYCDHPDVRAAIQKAADADARTHKEGLKVPGAEPKSERKV